MNDIHNHIGLRELLTISDVKGGWKYSDSIPLNASFKIYANYASFNNDDSCIVSGISMKNVNGKLDTYVVCRSTEKKLDIHRIWWISNGIYWGGIWCSDMTVEVQPYKRYDTAKTLFTNSNFFQFRVEKC